MVDSTSPKYGEKASYYSAVCLETGEVEWMELEGNSNSETSVVFLKQLKDKHHGPLKIIWDNAPSHRGEALRQYLRTPELDLRLMNLPGYNPDFNADEAIWGWRERRPRATCAWGPGRRCRNGSAASWPVWPTVKTRSDAAAAQFSNQGPRHSSWIPGLPLMHIPPWLWFSTWSSLVTKGAFGG